jgi:hypothetical protein
MRARAWVSALALAGLGLSLAGCPSRPAAPPPEPTPILTPAEPTPTPRPTPTPTPYVPNKRLDVGKIFNGMQIRTSLETEYGTTATADREEPGSYALDLKVHVKVPKPYRDLAQLAKLSPKLPAVLTGLPALLESAQISPFYDDFYRIKVTSLQQSLMHLDAMLTRHNFFDCETVLELQHPESKRRALLVQTDMDTDTDGSDSDRVPEIDGSSVTFQPFTSYRWAKKTQQPNSFLPSWEAKLSQIKQTLANGGLSAARKEDNKAAQKRLTEEISDLHKYSCLVAAVDPYVVLPGSIFAAHNHSPYAAAVGDYCVVIYGDRLFPAVIGDVGPSNIIGESSLRICKEISPRSDADNRATDDLKVTYLVFPGTAEKADVPDLGKWHDRCEALLKELGGYTGELMAWEDLTKPKTPPPPAATPPAVTPAPATPAPTTPGPKATPAPKATPTPKATPAPKATPPPATSAPATPPPIVN